MKRNRKQWLILLLGVIFIPVVGIKVYFEIESTLNNYYVQMDNYEKNMPIEVLTEHKTLKTEGYEVHYFVSGKENSESVIFLHPAFSDHRAPIGAEGTSVPAPILKLPLV